MYLTFTGLPADELMKAGGRPRSCWRRTRQKFGVSPRPAATRCTASRPRRSSWRPSQVRWHPEGRNGRGACPATASPSRPVESVTGKEIEIDPSTGDTTSKDFTIQIVKGGKETFVKAQPSTRVRRSDVGDRPGLEGADLVSRSAVLVVSVGEAY